MDKNENFDFINVLIASKNLKIKSKCEKTLKSIMSFS